MNEKTKRFAEHSYWVQLTAISERVRALTADLKAVDGERWEGVIAALQAAEPYTAIALAAYEEAKEFNNDAG